MLSITGNGVRVKCVNGLPQRGAAQNQTVPLGVEVDLSDLERTPKGSIVGRVWLVLDDYAFPERAWSDLIVVILGWWIEEFLRVQAADETTITLQFMDGPYSVRLQAPPEGDTWSVSLLRDRAPLGSKREATGLVQRAPFATGVVNVAREVIDACRRNGWSDDREVLKLGRLADALAMRGR